MRPHYFFLTISSALILAATSTLALPITDPAVSGLTGDQAVRLQANTKLEDVGLNLVRRHHGKKTANKATVNKSENGEDDTSDNAGEGNDMNDSGNEDPDNTTNGSLQDDTDPELANEASMPDMMTSDAQTQSENELADTASVKLAKEPVKQLLGDSDDNSASGPQSKLVKVQADTHHLLEGDHPASAVLSDVSGGNDRPDLIHSHASTAYYDESVTPNVGTASLTHSVNGVTGNVVNI